MALKKIMNQIIESTGLQKKSESESYIQKII